MEQTTEISIEMKVMRKLLRRILQGSPHPYFTYYTSDKGSDAVVIFYNPGINKEHKEVPSFIVSNANVVEFSPHRERLASPDSGPHAALAHWRSQFDLIDPVSIDYHNLDQATELFMERVKRALEK